MSTTRHSTSNVTTGPKSLQKSLVEQASAADPSGGCLERNVAESLLTALSLRATPQGWRVKAFRRKRTVIDGPFSETKEFIGSHGWAASSDEVASD